MQNDPRHKNTRFDVSSISAYVEGYASALQHALQSVDAVALDRARHIIEAAAAEGRRIFAIGNGGSSAIADHLCCDLTKGTHSHGHPTIDTQSMTSNVALYSAIANDFGFKNVFSTQINFVAKKGDVLLAISSSGNSENILEGVSSARSIGVHTIGLSGFEPDNKLSLAADVSLHIATRNYGIVEDAHQALMHIIAQYIAAKRDQAGSRGEVE